MLQLVHCVDRTYHATHLRTARIARLIPIWKQASDDRFRMAVSREKEHPPHSCLQTAVRRVIKCLSHTYSIKNRLTPAYIRLSHGV